MPCSNPLRRASGSSRSLSFGFEPDLTAIQTAGKEATAKATALEAETAKSAELMTRLQKDIVQKEHVLQWTQNKLQSETTKGAELADSLAKTALKLKEVCRLMAGMALLTGARRRRSGRR